MLDFVIQMFSRTSNVEIAFSGKRTRKLAHCHPFPKQLYGNRRSVSFRGHGGFPKHTRMMHSCGMAAEWRRGDTKEDALQDGAGISSWV